MGERVIFFALNEYLTYYYDHLAAGETSHDTNRRQELRSFWVTGKKGLTFSEASRAIVEEARDLLQKDLGVDIDWGTQEDRQKNISALLDGNTGKIYQKKRKTFKFSLNFISSYS